MSTYGGTLTAEGKNLLASLVSGDQITFTRVLVGSGKIGSDVDIKKLTALIEPIAEAALITPYVEDGVFHTTVEYRNDMNSGLSEGFMLNEFCIYAKTDNIQETLIYYATLGDAPQIVNAYSTGRVDIRRYAVSFLFTDEVQLDIAYNPAGYIKADEAEQLIDHKVSNAILNTRTAFVQDILIPAASFDGTDSRNPAYPLYADVAVADVKEDHFPCVSLDFRSLDVAKSARLCPTVESHKGFVRFWSKKVPAEDLIGTIALLNPRMNPVLSGGGGTTVVEIPAAEDMVFGTDLTTTTPIGYVELNESGQAVIEAEGKTIGEVWNTIYVKEKNPAITPPSVTLKSSTAKAYEVGTKVTPVYEATFSPGSYEYGPATGIIVNLWEISDSNGNVSEVPQGSFPELTVGDKTSYGITAIAHHAAGSIPLTNTGNPYEDGTIAEGTKIAASAKITGYRRAFYGTTVDKDRLTSDLIRALAGKSSGACSAGSKFTVSIPVGAMRVVIAYPATLRNLTSVKDVNGMNAEILSGFSATTIVVEGANEYEGVEYKVYTLEYAEANDTANTYNVQI